MIFKRENHRPWQFFEQSEQNILICPDSTDFDGILIAPLEKNIDKVSKHDLADLDQVLLNGNVFNHFCDSLIIVLA